MSASRGASVSRSRAVRRSGGTSSPSTPATRRARSTASAASGDGTKRRRRSPTSRGTACGSSTRVTRSTLVRRAQVRATSARSTRGASWSRSTSTASQSCHGGPPTSRARASKASSVTVTGQAGRIDVEGQLVGSIAGCRAAQPIFSAVAANVMLRGSTRCSASWRGARPTDLRLASGDRQDALAASAHEDGGCGAGPAWAGCSNSAIEVVAAGAAGRLVAERALEDGDGLLQSGDADRALVERQADGVVLLLAPARPDGHVQATAAQHVEGGEPGPAPLGGAGRC